MARQYLDANLAIFDQDAGVDTRHAERLARRGSQREQIGEMDRAPDPGHRAEARGKIGAVGREIAGRGDLAVAAPVDPALSAYGPVDQGHHALGQPRQLLGLETIAKANSGNVEVRFAIAGRQPMGDRNVGDLGPARRMAQRAGCLDQIIRQPEAQIIAGQRIKARSVGKIGHGRRAVDRQRTAAEVELARGIAQPDRNPANQRRRAAEIASRAAAHKPTRQRCGGDLDWGCRAPQPHPQPAQSEAVAAGQPRLGRGQRERRFPKLAAKPQIARRRADRHRTPARLEEDRAPGRAQRNSRRAEA